ncbi:unnamed protein product [Rhodiola kirilowii]
MVDLFTSHIYIHESAISSSPPSMHISHSSLSLTNFPIIAIAVIGISATAFLLVSYYIIVIKCCLNLHRVSITQDTDGSQMMHSPSRLQQLPKGLDQPAINSIPIIEFKKAENEDSLDSSFQECSVCLGEFKHNEKLRCLQDCSHLFHMDCIDVWLQNNGNCPLCRTSISYTNPSSKRPPRQDLTTVETTTCVESNFVVIEIQQRQQQQLEAAPPANHHHHHPQMPIKLELRDIPKKQRLRRMKQQVLSMGDECIDVRVIDDVFKIEPIRRSISMDSSNDQQLYLMVQDVVQHQKKCSSNVLSDEACSSSSGITASSRFKRPFFSFGSGIGCKDNDVLPTHVQP